jgi:hypothetical protein
VYRDAAEGLPPQRLSRGQANRYSREDWNGPPRRSLSFKPPKDQDHVPVLGGELGGAT